MKFLFLTPIFIASIFLTFLVSVPKLETGINYHEEEIEALERQIDPIPARITCYLWTGNRMANNKYPEKGYVATSDRSIPFGTIIEIDGIEYIVGDRTNKRFQDFEIMTIDIYWEDSLESCLKFGVQYKDIIIK